MKKLALVAASLLAATAMPAVAAPVFNAFTSFNGTQGAGNFTYALNPGPNQNLQYFSATTNCFIDGSTCLQQSADHDVPGVTKSTSPSFQYGSVNVPTDRLLLHPGTDPASSVDVLFRAPTAGTYNIRGTYNDQDVRPTGVGVSFFAAPGGATVTTPLGVINAANPSGVFTTSLFLNTGDAVGFSFDNAGFYGNDSTGFNFLASTGAVPEPATWAMMMLGFGMVGYGMRRRAAKVSTKVAYA